MRRLLLFALAILLTTAALPARTFALPPGKWWETPRLVEYIQLTPEQRTQIGDLVYNHAQRMIDLNAGVERTKLALQRQVDLDELDPNAVRKAFSAFQDARRRLEDDRFEMLLAVRQLLTREQWDRLVGLRERLEQSRQRRARPGEPPGPRERRPPGPGQYNGEPPVHYD